MQLFKTKRIMENLVPDFNNQFYLNEDVSSCEVIGKYAYNKRHFHGGIIVDANQRSFTLDDGTYHPTCTGDSVYDSFMINGYAIFETKEFEPETL